MGSSREAFLAGYQPKKTPVAKHTPKLTITLEAVMLMGQFKNSFTTVPMPRGKLDYASIFKALSDVGYKGVCSFEYERDFTNNLGGLAESVGYARGICDAVTAK